jgi:hypothetical protein
VNGYILFRRPDDTITRYDSHRGSRAALRRVLEEAVPAGQHIVGIVLGPQKQTHLQPVLRAS